MSEKSELQLGVQEEGFTMRNVYLPVSSGIPEKVVVMNDHQVPYQDGAAVAAVHKYVQDLQPHLIVIAGDMLDFAGLSTKFLRIRADKGRIMEDIAQARELLLDLQAKAPSARFVFIEGNHEARLRNYILERADEFEELNKEGGPLSLPTLLNVPGLEYYGPYGEAFVYRSFVFKHGEMTGKYAAARELIAEGSSGISGHTHRMQVYSRTDRAGAHAWYSNMCLCHVKGEPMPPGTVSGRNRVRDWQQGFATIYFNGDLYNVYQTVITGGRFVAPSGRCYGG